MPSPKPPRPLELPSILKRAREVEAAERNHPAVFTPERRKRSMRTLTPKQRSAIRGTRG